MSTQQEELIEANKATDNLTVEELEKASTDPLDTKEVQIAAGQYAQFSKLIRGRAKTMKAGGLARVMIAVAEFPFADSYPKFRVQAETDLFILLTSNDKAKAVINKALSGQEETLQQIAVDKVTNNILEKGEV